MQRRKRPLSIGFIGFGLHATRNHAQYLVENCAEFVKIVAIGDIVDTDTPLVQSRLSHLGLSNVAVYTVKADQASNPRDVGSVELLLKRHPEIEAMIISTPNAKHYFQARACLERGLHVLVDKPLALTCQQGQQLVALSNNTHGPYLLVSSQRRYERVYTYTKDAIKSGQLGRLISIDSYISHAHDWMQGWHVDPKLAGGGAVWSVGWHAVDTIVYLAGRRAIAVDASLYIPERLAVETHASALIFFEGGLSVTLTTNVGAPVNSVYEQIQLWGSSGTFIINRFRPSYDDWPALVTHQLANGTILQPDLNGPVQRSSPTAAFIRLLTSIHNATDHDAARAAVKSMGEESLETISVIEAIYRSANERARISLHSC